MTDKPDYTKSFVYATVGGCNSFNILSTKLHLSKLTYEYKWNVEKKGFIRKKIEDVEIKPANDDKRAYSGYASFKDSETGKLMVLVSSETKTDNGIKKDFVLLDVKPDLSVTEIELPLASSQLVYCTTLANPSDDDENDDDGDIKNSDMLFVFAPTFNKKNPVDYKKYTYLRIDKNGVIKENIKFDAPSANLIVSGVGQGKNGSIYLCGSYNNEDKTFDQLYKEYSPLRNPCYSQGANSRMDVYERKTEKVKMDYVSMIKCSNGKIDWITNNAIANFEKVLKTAPGQKKASIYKGNRLHIGYFSVSSNGDLFVAGQLKGRILLDKVSYVTYRDVICMQFNAQGEIKAQYGIKTESIGDKKNTIFQMPQQFYIGNDGQTLYWSLLEISCKKGYASFFDAYYGAPTYYANFYPSMIKININTNEISDYKIIGGRKFLLNKKAPYIYNEKDKSVIYIGSDKKSKLWLAKYSMN